MEEVRKQVKKELGTKWKDKKWTSFIVEVGEWLLGEGEDEDDVAETLVGLINYGAVTEKKLQNVGLGDYGQFKKELRPEGIPGAICDSLFTKYVAKKEVSAENICEEVLDKFLSDVDRPVLDEFKPPNVCNISLQSDVRLPLFPSESNRPYVLLYDVANEKHKESGCFKYLKNHRNYVRTIYGTSGAGKTRRVLEFLSHEYGLYFIANGDGVDPGSFDMSAVIKRCIDTAKAAPNFTDDISATSENNLKVVTNLMTILVYSRLKVFERLQKIYKDKFEGDEMSPFEWLLFQLHPNKFMNHDVFQDMAITLIDAGVNVPRPKSNQYVIIDEAQELLRKLEKDYFVSSKDASVPRSLYSAVAKGFGHLATNVACRFPVLTGTGLSRVASERELGSTVAKESSRVTLFDSFDSLDETGVLDYLGTFVKVEKTDEQTRNHIAKWLVGRPRWTASFASFAMQSEGEDLLQVFERYLHTLTMETPDVKKNQRNSWSLKHSSALSAIKRLGLESVESSSGKAVDEFMNAVMEFTVSGEEQIIHHEYSMLIEKGVCQLAVVKDDDRRNELTVAKMSEPIIVEAAVYYYSLETASMTQLRRAVEASTAGFVFERCILPALRKPEFIELLKKSGCPNALCENRFVSRSAYGVIAKRCQESGETIKWLDNSLNATLDGQVPPFCLPDTHMGPDIVFFLRKKDSFQDVAPALLQAKFRSETNQTEAMRSVTPDLLYVTNRSNASKMKNLAVAGWEDMKKRLFNFEGVMIERPRKEIKKAMVRQVDVVRMVVQTGKTKSTGKSGLRGHFDVQKDTTNDEDEGHDFQLSIGRKELVLLFGEADAESLMNIQNEISGGNGRKKSKV